MTKKHITCSELIEQLQKYPKDATVRIYNEEICPDADFFVVSVDYQTYNEANEVDLYVEENK